LPRLRQLLLHNLGIKITSLILAIAVYAHVYARQEQEAVLQLPLVLQGLPAGLTYRGDVPSSVRARVRARGAEVLKLYAQPPQAVIRLAQSREGRLQRPVTAHDVVLPDKSSAVVVEIVDPVVLSLEIEPVMSTLRPVRVDWSGRPPEGRILATDAVIEPPEVALTGPSGAIAEVESVTTAPVDLTERGMTFEEEVPVVPPAGVTAQPAVVRVRAVLVEAASRSFGPLPILLPGGARGAWRVEPESATVRLRGPGGLLRDLEPREVRVRALVPDAPEADDLVGLQVVLPQAAREHVEVEAIEPASVLIVGRAP